MPMRAGTMLNQGKLRKVRLEDMRSRRHHRLAATRRLGFVVAVMDLVIVVGVLAHLTGGVATGASLEAFGASDPMRLLGTIQGKTPCPTVPLAVGQGTSVICDSWTEIVSPAGLVEVVSIYGPNSSAVDQYPGALPLNLAWGDGVDAVWSILGRPSRITGVYGTPTLVYSMTGQSFGSLELRFDASDHLERINASILH